MDTLRPLTFEYRTHLGLEEPEVPRIHRTGAIDGNRKLPDTLAHYFQWQSANLDLTPLIRRTPKMVSGRRLSVDKAYRIFTDGSAIGNPGAGGWGVVLIQGKERWEMSGAHPWTTISEMELVAAVEALRSLEGRGRIELYCSGILRVHPYC